LIELGCSISLFYRIFFDQPVSTWSENALTLPETLIIELGDFGEAQELPIAAEAALNRPDEAAAIPQHRAGRAGKSCTEQNPT